MASDHMYPRKKPRLSQGAQCFAMNCYNYRNQHAKERGITFHTFPNKDKEPNRYDLWARTCRRSDRQPSKWSLLCSDHFTSEAFDHTGQTVRLREGAVPTVFDVPAHLQTDMRPRTTATSQPADPLPDVCDASDTGNDMNTSSFVEKLKDHSYCLEDPHDAAKIVKDLWQRIDHLQKDLKNTTAREKRAKSCISKLKESNLLTAELETKLEAFKEISSSFIMPLHYCPQCGTKLQPGFKFCPCCGGKLPSLLDLPESTNTEVSEVPDAVCELSTQVGLMSAAPVLTQDITLTDASGDPSSSSSSPPSSSSALTRSSIRSRRRSAVRKTCSASTPPKPATNKDQNAVPWNRKLKASPEAKDEEEQKKVFLPSPQTPPSGKAKRMKRVSAVEPVQEGLELCDQSGKKWRLGKLLSQMDAELTYEVQQIGVRSSSNESKHIMRLGAKDGQLFNEQNCLQRAAKPAVVEKWMKKLGLDFLGIPSCVGFGLHETYRFLIFPDMGCTLQSVLDTQKQSLSEREVLQLALRLLDALEFLHESEYVHADIHAGNIYISTQGHSQVFLSGFGHAFRFCPGGKHVEYREGGRTPHQGNLNFISVDSHKGTGPSRRSDLQSLGFCLLLWMTGSLPWSPVTQSGSAVSAQKERYMSDIPGLMSYCFKKRKVSSALQSYLSQVMSLHYTEKPDYSALKQDLNKSLQDLGGTLRDALICR
ncbi:inactive serine/threonine-protein kinase VRK3 [Ictalurus furcatus]|uniref:inactive serine/threonine-protein kinase VRK3 n=1 Tax=Ictalurus furcatus TaxID=66913 RepID=UPI002350B3F7|nr:inactive serine/threonine-protein kinase VRK3 [Ictalurus furcatus]